MKITGVDIYHYSLPLTNPLMIKGQEIVNRTGAILKLTDDSGSIAFGEVATLEGLHKETLKQAISQLKELENIIFQLNITDDLLNFNGSICEFFPDTYPSVLCAIEMAFFNLLLQKAGLPKSANTVSLPVNGLLAGDISDVLQAGKDLINAGYTSIKIKVGSSPLSHDIDTINKLTEIVDRKVTLRLDANRQWSLKEAIEFSQNIPSPVIEYIEEPVKDIENLPELIAITKIPVALDETLVEKGLTYAAGIENIKAYILKPSLLGGFDAAAKFIRYAETKGITPVISAAFTTSVSLKSYSLFAAFMGLSNIHHGLDTFKFLKFDVIENSFKTDQGTASLADIVRSTDLLRSDLLEVV